jgi:hypothetical protein
MIVPRVIVISLIPSGLAELVGYRQARVFADGAPSLQAVFKFEQVSWNS